MKMTVYGDKALYWVVDRYASNGSLCIQLWEGHGPFCRLTVNLEGFSDVLDPDCAFVDVNNFPDAEKLITDNNLGRWTGMEVYSGFCKYPEYRFNIKKLTEVTE